MVGAQCRLVIVMSVLLLALLPLAAPAEDIEHAAFQRVWARTDMPVATLQVARTWIWGPEAASPLLVEPYREAPGGQRPVQYFDKSRMEINDPAGDQTSPWYVTNGLLATELITGRMQVGDSAYELYAAAQVNVAGDPDDPDAPTYATFAALLGTSRGARATPVVERLARDGTVEADPYLAQWAVNDEQWVPETGRWIPQPFWAFMAGSGLVFEEGVYFPDDLFLSPFYATGYPITDAYWATVRVGGAPRDVLVQCFERRCLTYTPFNAPEWRVEAGNIGSHYYTWRYTQLGKTPVEAPNQTGDVRIVAIFANPADDPAIGHEYVDLNNVDVIAIQLAGWRLSDAAGTTYTFPTFKLPPGATVRLHVARGVDTATDLYWGRTGSVWNNDGDTAYLYDGSGALVQTYGY
jgi:hypothetical protein